MEFRVEGSEFRVWGLGGGVQGLGFRFSGSGFRVQGSGCRVHLEQLHVPLQPYLRHKVFVKHLAVPEAQGKKYLKHKVKNI